MAARVAASQLTTLGLEEMIADSPQQYEERAYHLATHPAELAQIRARLADNRLSMPLFDTERQVRNLEAAFRAMWQRQVEGHPPATFHVAIGDVASSGNCRSEAT